VVVALPVELARAGQLKPASGFHWWWGRIN
jgi:hypothetical protein